MRINDVYNMDCIEGMGSMKDCEVDHVFTSPPYNRKRNDKYKFYDDVIVDYKGFLIRVIDECLRVSKDYVFFNIQKNYYNKTDVFDIIGHYSKELIDIIIWNKNNPMPASGLNVTNSYEFILVLSKNKKSLKSNYTYTKNILSTSVYSSNKFSKVHKAVMNPEAAMYIIKNFTKEEDLILDTFMGVGTTGVVCRQLNRKFIGFELDKEYCNLANERIKNSIL